MNLTNDHFTTRVHLTVYLGRHLEVFKNFVFSKTEVHLKISRKHVFKNEYNSELSGKKAIGTNFVKKLQFFLFKL